MSPALQAEFFGFPCGSDSKESACNAGSLALIPGSRKIPWRRECLPTPVFLPGEFHGQRSLEGSGPWGRKESDTTEQVTLSLSLRRVTSQVVNKDSSPLPAGQLSWPAWLSSRHTQRTQVPSGPASFLSDHILAQTSQWICISSQHPSVSTLIAVLLMVHQAETQGSLCPCVIASAACSHPSLLEEKNVSTGCQA